VTDPSIATALTYDRVTQEYHDKRRDRSLAQERLARIGALLGPGRNRVLDLGCGPGYDAALIRAQGHCAIGADLSSGMLSFARRHYPGPYLRTDMRRLPFAAAFDAIWANASMLHLEPTDFPGALAECHRVLKAGGYLALSLKAGEGQAWENGRFAVEDAPRFFTYWTAADLDRALAAARFTSVGGATGDGTDGHQTWLSRLVQKPR
jgi:SAM-dependent methyltransferase